MLAEVEEDMLLRTYIDHLLYLNPALPISFLSYYSYSQTIYLPTIGMEYRGYTAAGHVLVVTGAPQQRQINSANTKNRGL